MSIEQSRQKFAEIKPWIANELKQLRHLHDSGEAQITSCNDERKEYAWKCYDPNSGESYFWFHEASNVKLGEILVWKNAENWCVLETSLVRSAIRCKVRAAILADRDVEELLQSVGLSQAAGYLRQAKVRLVERTPASWSECRSNCRNALQSAIEQMTGVSGPTTGMPKLKDVLSIGTTEVAFIKAFENQMKEYASVLSKKGSHPPMPEEHFATWAYESTSSLLKFLALCFASKK